MNKTDNQTINTENIEHPIFSPKEKPPQFPFLIRRTLEFLFSSILCSLPVAILYAIGVVPKTNSLALKLMGTSLFAFILVSGYFLRAFYYSMGNKKVYFNVNVTAYTIFAILNIATFIIFKDVNLPSLYSYIFMPMKLINVILNMLLTSTASQRIQILSPIITHLFMYALIFIAPLEMYRFDKKKK